MDITGNISRKEAHEIFVSGHTGTTVSEISVIAFSCPVAVLLRNVMRHALNRQGSLSLSVQFAIDFVLLMSPMTMCITVLSANAGIFLLSLIILIISVLMLTYRRDISRLKLSSDLLNIEMTGQRPFVTNYRAFVNAASAVCILAVDFVVFPRRLCKTETYGTGLMDAGVASFVFANAIVSPEARGHVSSVGTVSRIMKSLMSTAPLWLLGFARLLSVKSTDYHEHLTEYGVHWNFFFTLAIVRVLSTVLLCLTEAHRSWVIAIAVISVYQLALSVFGLREYILDVSNKRVGLLDANREGICSCCGYMALSFAGVQFGRLLLKSRSTVRDWLTLLVFLMLIDISFLVLLTSCETFVDRVSRRLANLSYFIWMVAYNVQLVAAFLLVDILQTVFITITTARDLHTKKDDKMTSFDLLEAINANGLLYFLLANLLTGVVNLSTVTMLASTSLALTELTVYMLTLSLVVGVLHVHSIRVKFW